MKPLKLLNRTIYPGAITTTKEGKTIKILSLEDRIKKDKERGREYGR
jgi:hypothetical protein